MRLTVLFFSICRKQIYILILQFFFAHMVLRFLVMPVKELPIYNIIKTLIFLAVWQCPHDTLAVTALILM